MDVLREAGLSWLGLLPEQQYKHGVVKKDFGKDAKNTLLNLPKSKIEIALALALSIHNKLQKLHLAGCMSLVDMNRQRSDPLRSHCLSLERIPSDPLHIPPVWKAFSGNDTTVLSFHSFSLSGSFLDRHRVVVKSLTLETMMRQQLERRAVRTGPQWPCMC